MNRWSLPLARGEYSVQFDVKSFPRQNDRGGLASGVYLYKLTSGSSVEVRKMTLAK